MRDSGPPSRNTPPTPSATSGQVSIQASLSGNGCPHSWSWKGAPFVGPTPEGPLAGRAGLGFRLQDMGHTRDRQDSLGRRPVGEASGTWCPREAPLSLASPSPHSPEPLEGGAQVRGNVGGDWLPCPAGGDPLICPLRRGGVLGLALNPVSGKPSPHPTPPPRFPG